MKKNNINSKKTSSNSKSKVKRETVKKGATKKIKDKSTKKSRAKRIGKIALMAFLGFGILAVLAIGFFMIYIIVSAPEFEPDVLYKKESTVVYDANGNEIIQLGREKRERISYDELPQVLIDAIIATEDSRFFQHNGFDLPRFAKASFKQLLGNDDAGGASTLSMQVVKNSFTDPDLVSGFAGLTRKFTDIYMAIFKLESNYTKEEILEFYVNDSFLGNGAYGVEQASQSYFGKSARDLTLAEASLIAGLYQSPSNYNPYIYPEKAENRRATVLNLMVRHGYISSEEAEIAKSIPVEKLLVGKNNDSPYQGFIDLVIEEVEEKTGNDPYEVPMKIYTTLNTDMQNAINRMMNGESLTWENDTVQAGIAIVDVNTGAVSAVGNGRNRDGAKIYSFAARMKRQPGSTAKPLFDYGPGFEYNNWSTYTLFMDEPYTYSDDKPINNWDGGYFGLTTLKDALMASRNIPALKAFQQVNNKNIIEFVTKLGIEPEIEGNFIHEAHAIGGFTGVSPLDMAAAYAAFANGGYYTEPYTVTSIEYRETGKVETFKPQKERVMSESTAYLINHILQSAVESGYDGGARVYGMAVAAKTGTTNFDEATIRNNNLTSTAVNDLWTIAYTPEYSVGLWYGYENLDQGYHKYNNTYYKNTIMSTIFRDAIPKTNKKFNVPNSVIEVAVEKGTEPAMLPSEYTPDDQIVYALFKKGTEPVEVSKRFAKLDDVTNLESEYNKNKGTITLSWEHTTPTVLSEDYLETYFSQSVFGQSKDALIKERTDYNKNILGELGYSIYIKDSTDKLTFVEFTKEKEYVYTIPSRNTSDEIEFVVKVEHELFKDNASDGISESVEVTITTSTSQNNNNNTQTTDVTVTLLGNEKYDLEIGDSYTEPKPAIKVISSSKDVTNEASISITVTKGNTTSTVTSSKPIESLIDSANPGTFTIQYTVTYKNKTYKKTRTVTFS